MTLDSSRSAFGGLYVGVMLLVSASCASDRRAVGADTSGTTTSAKAAAESASRTPASSAPAGSWTAGPSGVGPVRVGMSIDELRAATPAYGSRPVSEECQYVRSEDWPSGVSVMVARGRVVRIDVDSAGVRTTEGIGVGDLDSRIREVYGARAAETRHKYVTGGKYYSVVGPSVTDSSHRIVFETENGRVARFRAGRLPEVEWVERCG